jgi:hypothetical protein
MPLPSTLDFVVGVDLGQAVDFTAVSILEIPLWIPNEEECFRYRARRAGWTSPDRLDLGHVVALRQRYEADRRTGAAPSGMPLVLRHLDRWRGVSYVEIVRRLAALMDAPAFRGRSVLVADRTGVGRPVLDALRAAGLSPVGITLTGGTSVTRDGHDYRVPKADVVAALQLLTQRLEGVDDQDRDRLRVPRRMPLADVLLREMETFRIRIDPVTAHDSYASWREGEHDDLILSVALAAWYLRERMRRSAGEPIGFCGHMVPIAGPNARTCPECRLGPRPADAREGAHA